VITGSRDWAFGAAQASRMAALSRLGEAMVIEHAGPFVWVEQPTTYANSVERFLGR
jgi:pimeloyl-ACP methyl ester carboxylesterase